jgi:hypothetical protein
MYIASVDELLSSAVTTTTRIEKVLEYEFPIEEYDFHDETALQQFMNRWNLHTESCGKEMVIASCKCYCPCFDMDDEAYSTNTNG